MLVISGQCAALIIFITGFLAIFFCICSLRIIYKSIALKNAFGLICATQSLVGAGTAACSAFWAAPTLFFNSSIAKSTLGFGVGHIVLLLSFSTSWLHLCKSLNRCYAIILPIQYHKNFTLKNTVKVIVCFMGLAFLSIISSFFPPCNYYFNIENYLWQSRDISCLETVGIYTDLTILFVAVGGSVICDMITLFYLVTFNKRIKQRHGPNLYNEKKFFAQTFCTTFIYFLSTALNYIVADKSLSVSVNFLLLTFNWQLFTIGNEKVTLYCIHRKDKKYDQEIFYFFNSFKS